jgi:hypothetical protein
MFRKRVQVFVCDEPHTITVFRRYRAVWIAHGMYMGKSLTVQDQTEGGAMKRWRAIAEATTSGRSPAEQIA